MVEPQPKIMPRLRSDTAAQSADDSDDETEDGIVSTASLMQSEDRENSDNNDTSNNHEESHWNPRVDPMLTSSAYSVPRDLLGFLTILVYNYGGRRKHDKYNDKIQEDIDATTSTVMCFQEAGGEFRRSNVWMCVGLDGDYDTGLVTCVRVGACSDITRLDEISHEDGFTRTSPCFVT